MAIISDTPCQVLSRLREWSEFAASATGTTLTTAEHAGTGEFFFKPAIPHAPLKTITRSDVMLLSKHLLLSKHQNMRRRRMIAGSIRIELSPVRPIQLYNYNQSGATGSLFISVHSKDET